MRTSPVAYLLWCMCFIGVCGVHRFYAGKWKTGLLWLLTGGLLYIGQIVDLFLVPGMIDDANRRDGAHPATARRSSPAV